MGSRFNFTLARKVNRANNFSTKGKPNPDAIRLTKTHLIIGANLGKRFPVKGSSTYVKIEKDPDANALRIVPDKSQQAFSITKTSTSGGFFTKERPAALYDMPRGSYIEDLKEPGVYVLES